eukprot:8526658-Pyramimonas_sp.AAC.1
MGSQVEEELRVDYQGLSTELERTRSLAEGTKMTADQCATDMKVGLHTAVKPSLSRSTTEEFNSPQIFTGLIV